MIVLKHSLKRNSQFLMYREIIVSLRIQNFGIGFGLKYDKKNDYYEILGVSPRSQEKDLKKSYYKLAQKYHPDRTGGNKEYEEKFKKISAAYEVLKDKSQRQIYDQMREAERNPNSQGFGSQGPFGGASQYQRQQQQQYNSTGGPRSQQSSSSRGGQQYQGNFYGNQKTSEDFYRYYSKYDENKKKAEDFMKNQWKDFWDKSKEGEDKSSKQNDFYKTKTKTEYQEHQRRSQSQQQEQQQEKYSNSGFKYSGSQYDKYTKQDGSSNHQQSQRSSQSQSSKQQDYSQRKEYETYNYKDDFYSQSDKNSKYYDSKSNFNKFKENRFNEKPKPKTYKKWEPKLDSIFHNLNRGYNQQLFVNKLWKVVVGLNPFEIRDYKGENKPKTPNDRLFEEAQKVFKGQTKESMTREHLNFEETRKMMPISRVLAGLGFITLGYKAVDKYVA